MAAKHTISHWHPLNYQLGVHVLLGEMWKASNLMGPRGQLPEVESSGDLRFDVLLCWLAVCHKG